VESKPPKGRLALHQETRFSRVNRYYVPPITDGRGGGTLSGGNGKFVDHSLVTSFLSLGIFQPSFFIIHNRIKMSIF
jgi:hypothetical protein